MLLISNNLNLFQTVETNFFNKLLKISVRTWQKNLLVKNVFWSQFYSKTHVSRHVYFKSEEPGKRAARVILSAKNALKRHQKA